MINFKKSIPSLPVVSIKKAVHFYETKMGFHTRHQEDYFAILVRDAIEIHLWASCDISWKFRSIALFLKPIWSGAETFLAGTASCHIEVEGIDELYREFSSQQVLHKEHPEVTDQPWGHRDFNTIDLYGNMLTFFQEIS